MIMMVVSGNCVCASTYSAQFVIIILIAITQIKDNIKEYTVLTHIGVWVKQIYINKGQYVSKHADKWALFVTIFS